MTHQMWSVQKKTHVVCTHKNHTNVHGWWQAGLALESSHGFSSRISFHQSPGKEMTVAFELLQWESFPGWKGTLGLQNPQEFILVIHEPVWTSCKPTPFSINPESRSEHFEHGMGFVFLFILTMGFIFMFYTLSQRRYWGMWKLCCKRFKFVLPFSNSAKTWWCQPVTFLLIPKWTLVALSFVVPTFEVQVSQQVFFSAKLLV